MVILYLKHVMFNQNYYQYCIKAKWLNNIKEKRAIKKRHTKKQSLPYAVMAIEIQLDIDSPNSGGGQGMAYFVAQITMGACVRVDTWHYFYYNILIC